MLRRRRLGAAVLALAALALLGCAETVRSRTHPALAERELRPRRVAVAPFRLAGDLAQAPAKAEPAESSAGPAAALVSRRLAEALAARGVEVVPPEEVALALGVEGVARERLDPQEAARKVAEAFGASGLLTGALWRFEERSGQAAGSLRPAGVGFEVTLHAAPGGEPLWSAVFDETQRALTENLFNAARYPGRGFRWLTAEQLATWGARETASAAPVEP